MKSKPLEISIVGAGIGGLVAALALKKRGHKPTIYEKTESLSELGAGIQLSPNANKVLEYLGVMEGYKFIGHNCIRNNGLVKEEYFHTDYNN